MTQPSDILNSIKTLDTVTYIAMIPGSVCNHVLMQPSFLPWGARYYNCVPFAGCVFVAPSKLYQPRVKTFEEQPLEVPPHKAPQVGPCLSPHNNLFEPAVTFCQKYHFDFEQFTKIALTSAGQPDGQRDGAGLRRAEED